MNGLAELAAKAILNSKELLAEIYKDAAKPGVAQVGEAVGTILGLGNTLLLPLRLINERASAAFIHNMDLYREKLKDVPVEKICSVSPEIGVPLLERLSYVTDDAIAEMFVQLLANASQAQHADETHPAFVHVIDNMSPDEARLLKALSPFGFNLYGMYQLSPPGTRVVMGQRKFLLPADFLEKAKLTYPDYVSAYLENLTRLGILATSLDGAQDFEKEVADRIQEACAPLLEGELLAKVPGAVHWHFGHIYYTDFGRFFRSSSRPNAALSA